MRRLLSAALTAALVVVLALAAHAGGFGDVKEGMSESEVRAVLGEPDDIGGNPTWKQFVPRVRRFATDTKRRTWVYSGKGKVVFSYNKYTDMYKVRQTIPE